MSRAPGAALGAWLAYEQTVNERIANDRAMAPIDDRSNTVRPDLRPEARQRWALDVLWLKAAEARTYGPAVAELRMVLGLRVPRGRAPMFVHPQSRGVYRRRLARARCEPAGVEVTPTASYRSLLAWGPRGAAILKVSLGATVARLRRTLGEEEIARALFVNTVLETIPRRARQTLRFDWFRERAGVVDADAGHGWLLRGLPPALRGARGTLVPAFSLISRRPSEPPLLVDLVRRSGEAPEVFVTRHLLAPYVSALGYLLLEEGVAFDGHTQNVLFELGAAGDLSGRIVLRDLSYASVNLALRIAKRKPLPAAQQFPRDVPLRVVSNAADHRFDLRAVRTRRAGDTAITFGLDAFVWAVNHSLRRFFPGYDVRAVERAYLRLWQSAAVTYLGALPLLRARSGQRPPRLALDEAVGHFLATTDWSALRARPVKGLPPDVEPLRLGAPPRRPGRAYGQIDSAWGELFIDGTVPAYFRPAF